MSTVVNIACRPEEEYVNLFGSLGVHLLRATGGLLAAVTVVAVAVVAVAGAVVAPVVDHRCAIVKRKENKLQRN